MMEQSKLVAMLEGRKNKDNRKIKNVTGPEN